MILPKSDFVKHKTNMESNNDDQEATLVSTHLCSNYTSATKIVANRPRLARQMRPTLFTLFVLAMFMVASFHIEQTLADDSKQSNTSNRGLFSHVNNWFSRLRGNRDNQNSNTSNDEKKTEDKKEESSTQANQMTAYPGYPPMAHSPFSPLGPFGPQMMSPMYGPMGMATHQFAQHVPAGAPGGPRGPPGMQMAGGLSMGFNPMSPMGNPYGFGGAPMMPVHHDYPESLHPHHHGHHGTESFGHFGHNSPYGSFGGSADPSEDGYSSASASNGETMEGAASNHAHGTLGPHGTGEYDPYHKK